jgi:hypothetical protein
MPEPTPIVITDLRIPFIRLVMFFVKRRSRPRSF